MSVDSQPPYPNGLRVRREQLSYTRAQVIEWSKQLEAQDPIRWKAISSAPLFRIESGIARPRAKAAATLAEILQSSVDVLFPKGIDPAYRGSKENLSK